MLPNFIIIGAARCGTTYISSNLKTHPNIFLAPKKELHFFDRDYDQGLEYYEKYFPENESNQFSAVGEATPAYLYFEEVPKRIFHALPNCKLIASLRNPIDAAYSMYWKAFSVDERTRAITFEEKLKRDQRLINGGLYFEQLSRYTTLFPRENLHVIIYEELTANPEEHFKQLFKFLNVDQEFTPPFLRTKVNSSAMKNSEHRFLYHAHRILFKKLNLPFPTLANLVENNFSAKIPPMSQETRSFLYKHFKEDMMRLEEFLDKDLDSWKPDS